VPSSDTPIRNTGAVALEGLDVSEADLLAALEAEDAAAMEAGAVSGDEVWFEFVTQEDDRVRPMHAALHGSVWRVGDPAAPVPPIDYGCRCGMRYVAPPGSPAAKVLPVAKAVPATHADAFRAWLAARFKVSPAGIGSVVGSLEKVPLADRQGAATARVQARLLAMGEPGTLTEARPLATMLLAIERPRGGTAPPPPPTPPVVPPAPAPAPAPTPPIVPPPAPAAPAPTLAGRAAAALPVASASWGKPAKEWTPEEREANRVVGRSAANAAIRATVPLRAEARTAFAAVTEAEAAAGIAGAHAQAARADLYYPKAGYDKAVAAYVEAPEGPARVAAKAVVDKLEPRFLELDKQWREAEARAASTARARDEARKALDAVGDKVRAAVVAANPKAVGTFDGWKRVADPVLKARPTLVEDVDRFGKLVAASSGWVPERVAIHASAKSARGSAERNGAGTGVHAVKLSARPGVGSHELGHTLEYDGPDVLKAAIALLKRRTAGKPLEWLRDRFKGAGYKANEVFRDGGFVDPYVSKDYGRAMLAASLKANAGGGKKAARAAPAYGDWFGKAGADADTSEVVSMGMEWLAMRPAELLARDPQHFRLAVRAAMGAR
jgi:hypothetical protein